MGISDFFKMRSPDAASDSQARRGYSKKVLLLIASTAMLVFLLIILMTYFRQADEIVESIQTDYSMMEAVDDLLIELLRVETSINSYTLTDEEQYLDSFESHFQAVKEVLQHVQREWSGYEAQTSIVALKTDINIAVNKLQDMAANDELSDRRELQVLMSSKELLQDIRDELRHIQAAIVKRTRDSHRENMRQFSHIKWSMVSLCAISFALILILFRMTIRWDQLNRQVARTLSEKNEELEERVAQRTDELSDLAAYLTAVNEDEKKRIARELHDELGALLTAANMDTAWIARHLEPSDQERFSTRLERLADNLKKGIQLKRQITDSLVPPLLQELGLAEAMVDMIRVEKSLSPQTAYRLQISDTLQGLEQEQELALYRICQESLTNIKKYARATEVDIVVDLEDGMIGMTIRDDGVGFDVNNRKPGTHGLVGMKSRASMFDGTLDVRSEPGEGTVVQVSIKQKNAGKGPEGLR